MLEVLLRRAEPRDAARISEVAIRSKAYWGYDADLWKPAGTT
jgi:hypothetical protein